MEVPLYTAVSGKFVLKERKAYATVSKGSMGCSEGSVQELDIHAMKKMSNDFQRFGNG